MFLNTKTASATAELILIFYTVINFIQKTALLTFIDNIPEKPAALFLKEFCRLYISTVFKTLSECFQDASASVFLLVLYLAEFVYDELRVHVLFVHEPNPA